MSKETKLQGIILKKQAFGEADEIVTCFTKELGKVRFLAKSVKLFKSKLQHALQLPFYLEFKLTEGRGSLAKIISAQTLQTFSFLRENPELGSYAFFGLESVLKFTPDEQKNESLFFALLEFLKHINLSLDQKNCKLELLKFKIVFLDALGFSITIPEVNLNNPPVGALGFSNSSGGFTLQQCFDFRMIGQNTLENFLSLVKNNHGLYFAMEEIEELNHLLSGFLTYHLEREIKSEKFIVL